MDDKQILSRISELVEEEQRLHALGERMTTEDRRRLDDIEVAVDQAWDLLRQRRARRKINEDPDSAHPRDPNTVEGYIQ